MILKFYLLLVLILGVKTNNANIVNNNHLVFENVQEESNVKENEENLDPDFFLSSKEINLLQIHGSIFVDSVAIVLDNCANKFDATSSNVQKIIEENITDFKSESTLNTESPEEVDFSNGEIDSKSKSFFDTISSELEKWHEFMKNIFSHAKVDHTLDDTLNLDLSDKNSVQSWKQFRKLLKVIKYSCDALPTAITDTIANSRNEDNKENLILNALVKWGDKWFTKIEKDIESFLSVCFDEPECNKFSRIVRKLLEYVFSNYEFPQEDITDGNFPLKSLLWSRFKIFLSGASDHEYNDHVDSNEKNYWIALSAVDESHRGQLKLNSALEDRPMLASVINIIRFPLKFTRKGLKS